MRAIENTEGRIIPTRMGTRSGETFMPPQNKDHPHAYGDKHILDDVLRSKHGSSPRVWGQDVSNCPVHR